MAVNTKRIISFKFHYLLLADDSLLIYQDSKKLENAVCCQFLVGIKGKSFCGTVSWDLTQKGMTGNIRKL